MIENDNFNSSESDFKNSLENKKCSMHCDQFDSKLKVSRAGLKLAFHCLKTGIEVNSGDDCQLEQPMEDSDDIVY